MSTDQETLKMKKKNSTVTSIVAKPFTHLIIFPSILVKTVTKNI